ncbi:fungal specific transcription factor domain-containing protein [Aspergillus aculeatinus CBS 121060]|uniref:Uncharacterized protein n=1 Tax=Aspergillus aculeatinus CBS 121060 TaxID=1448322 RepID=A0ACD1GYB1_9EURO|nr:hypothetical protein BO66DRAFT_183684 [Aspergillus aculeatinus CBS 121060]RAH66313.1 hypothetical protein BO66DRAFT_183684 [Aspergillus aculeatinus CBS 121060]
MQNITHDLLLGDIPGNPVLSNRNDDDGYADDNLQLESLISDEFLNTKQSIASELESTSLMDVDDQSQSIAQLHSPAATPDDELKFIENYFASYHTLYPMLHEDTFRSVQRGQIPPPYWPVLFNMVLAFGAWLDRDASQDSDNVYFAKAEEHFENVSMGSQGNITLVQGLVLLSDFAQKQGSPEKSGRYIGSAVQISIALRLQVEPQDPIINELDKEIRRRVWWSVYCAESCSAKIYGRPLLLPEDALITVKPVSNIHESTLTSSSNRFRHNVMSQLYTRD